MMNLTRALVAHRAIETTVHKGKELRRYAEPLITMARHDTVENRRRAFALLRDRDTVQTLFNEIGPAYADRPGGYLRLLNLGPRPGDAAAMARVELVGLGEKAEE
jgi:large subunit ribosomal protein L17